MIVITGKNYQSALEERNHEKILFPEYGKTREELKTFVSSLTGEEVLVTASLELIDMLLAHFRGEDNVLVYSDTGKSLTFKEAFELRKYLDFDLRGGDFKGEEKVSVLFVEGKTDSKFFKAAYKKVFGFTESRTRGNSRNVPKALKPIETLFDKDNYELIVREGTYLAIIPSEGNSGVVRNLGNFLRAMDVFDFNVDKIGVAIDIDEDEERVIQSITGKLSSFASERQGENFQVGETVVVPVLPTREVCVKC